MKFFSKIFDTLLSIKKLVMRRYKKWQQVLIQE